MLFHSTLRKELARSFGATFVVLLTIVMTQTLFRVLGLTTRGGFNPADLMVVMWYTLLGQLATILAVRPTRVNQWQRTIQNQRKSSRTIRMWLSLPVKEAVARHPHHHPISSTHAWAQSHPVESASQFPTMNMMVKQSFRKRLLIDCARTCQH